MKVWYQVMSSFDQRPGFKNTLAEYIKGIADPRSEFDVHGTNATLQAVEFRAIYTLKSKLVLGNALTAEHRGFDAFAIGNSLDTSLHEARQAVDIPVVSYLETALQVMSMMGRNFAMIIPHRQFIPFWTDLVTGHGFKNRLVSIEALGVRPIELEQAYTNQQIEENRIEACLEAGRRAVAAGAEVILALPSSWYLRLTKRGITEVDGAPFFNGVAALVKMTELMVEYRRITGTFISRKLTYASPPREMLEEALVRNHVDFE